MHNDSPNDDGARKGTWGNGLIAVELNIRRGDNSLHKCTRKINILRVHIAELGDRLLDGKLLRISAQKLKSFFIFKWRD